MSRYDAIDDYVYPGTTVLRNKADIREQTAFVAFDALNGRNQCHASFS